VDRWLTILVERNAADLFLVAGFPPAVRIDGSVTPLAEPPLNADDIEAALRVLGKQQAGDMGRHALWPRFNFHRHIVLAEGGNQPLMIGVAGKGRVLAREHKRRLRRGGGLLMLGGRRSFAEGGWAGTPVAEVLAQRHGVCQDFAHLAIACLRSLGLPARYVSGYLETVAPPGRPRLQGADSSHAWFAVYVPQLGWVDFDPTNDCLPAERHVTTAWGRDYADVTPIKGVIFGGGAHTLKVSVDMQRIA
jgi:hypothetical protein